MRLVAHLDDLDLSVAGILVGDRVLTMAVLAERFGLREELALLDPRGLLAEDEDLAETRAALERALGGGVVGVPAASLRLAPPLEPGKIVCVGQNYASHVREQGLPLPSRPMLFAKFANAVVGDGDPVIHPATTHALDLEAELAVVIGRRARRVTAAEALAHVAAYTTANDISARDLQGVRPALRGGRAGRRPVAAGQGIGLLPPAGPLPGHRGRARRSRRPPRPRLPHAGGGPRGGARGAGPGRTNLRHGLPGRGPGRVHLGEHHPRAR